MTLAMVWLDGGRVQVKTVPISDSVQDAADIFERDNGATVYMDMAGTAPQQLGAELRRRNILITRGRNGNAADVLAARPLDAPGREIQPCAPDWAENQDDTEAWVTP